MVGQKGSVARSAKGLLPGTVTNVKFILYSQFNEEVIQSHLGEPGYSYYFILKAFQHVLADLGTVQVVRQPELEVDAIFEDCRARGEPCVFLPFAPAGKIPLDLKCPTVPVVAWEFSTFPDASLDEGSRNEWRVALAKLGRAIALSRYSARVIAEAMDRDFQISAVPPPLPARKIDDPTKESASIGLDIESGETTLDTAVMNLQADLLAPATRPANVASGAIEESPLATGRHFPEFTSARETRVRLDAASVVYTAVLNPNDRTKNVSDLVTGFCWAFREIPDATLVLKVGHPSWQSFSTRLTPILHQLSPFKCRVCVIPGFLPAIEYEKLIRATTYYVNTSSAEGVCLPLMEFMSCGKPAIAPAHTAMSDYVDHDVAFLLRASRQITSWPNDPLERLCTMSFRLDWESLREAYRQSYELARINPAGYREMSERARERMREYASPASITEQLRRFFAPNAVSSAGPSHGRHSATEQVAGRG